MGNADESQKLHNCPFSGQKLDVESSMGKLFKILMSVHQGSTEGGFLPSAEAEAEGAKKLRPSAEDRSRSRRFTNNYYNLSLKGYISS